MIILGIDPGTAATGYGLLKNSKNKMQVVDYGCIYTRSSLEMPERLILIAKDLKKIIKKYKPKIMAVEELFFFNNVKTAITVGQARGVVLLVGKSQKLEICEYTPLQVKQAVVSYGRADKNQIQQMVKTILKLESIPKPDDAADALAVAMCCANSIRFEKMTKTEMSAHIKQR